MNRGVCCRTDRNICSRCVFMNIKETQNVETHSQRLSSDWKNATGSKRGMLTLHNDSKCHQEAANKTIHYNHIISQEKKDIYASLRPLVCLGNIGPQATPVELCIKTFLFKYLKSTRDVTPPIEDVLAASSPYGLVGEVKFVICI